MTDTHENTTTPLPQNPPSEGNRDDDNADGDEALAPGRPARAEGRGREWTLESSSIGDQPSEPEETGGLVEALLALRAMFDGAEMPDSAFRDMAILTSFHAMVMTRPGNTKQDFDSAIDAAAGLTRAMIRARNEARKVDKAESGE